MRKLFIHIGLPKTATTTLQSFLYENRDNLRNYGYLYPQTGIPDKLKAHRNLSWLIVRRKKADLSFGTWKELNQEVDDSNFKNVIISSEFFSIANNKHIDILKSKLKFYDVKIVVYLRRQDVRIESQYTQNVKNGIYASDIVSFAHKKRDESDYYKVLEPWRQAFGTMNIIVRPLEKTQIPDICNDILNVIGINDFKDFSKVKDRNTKPGKKELEILRVINQVYKNDVQKSGIYKKKIAQYAQKYCSDDKKYRLLSYVQASTVMELYKESNQAVAREYLGREDGILFYEQLEPYDLHKFGIEDLSKKELLGSILAILDKN